MQQTVHNIKPSILSYWTQLHWFKQVIPGLQDPSQVEYMGRNQADCTHHSSSSSSMIMPRRALGFWGDSAGGLSSSSSSDICSMTSSLHGCHHKTGSHCHVMHAASNHGKTWCLERLPAARNLLRSLSMQAPTLCRRTCVMYRYACLHKSCQRISFICMCWCT